MRAPRLTVVTIPHYVRGCVRLRQRIVGTSWQRDIRGHHDGHSSWFDFTGHNDGCFDQCADDCHFGNAPNGRRPDRRAAAGRPARCQRHAHRLVRRITD